MLYWHGCLSESMYSGLVAGNWPSGHLMTWALRVLMHIIELVHRAVLLSDVALSTCDYSQSEIRIVLNMLTNNSQFPSKQWMTQRQCVYELSYWHNTQLICVKRVKDSWMIISINSYVRISLIQLNAIVTYCTEWHLRVISCLLFHCCMCI